jgi:hypothetical protein
LDLGVERDRLFAEADTAITELQQQFGETAITQLPAEPEQKISYPVLEYPTKVSSFNFDKTAEVSGQLQGIKGQYLIFDTGVINIRKFSGYQVEMVV